MSLEFSHKLEASQYVDEKLSSIEELASQAYKTRWVNKRQADFTSSAGLAYEVMFHGEKDNYTLYFRPRDDFSTSGTRYERTGKGDSFKILTTVLNLLKEFLTRNPGSTVSFEGSDQAQHEFYRKAMKRFADRFGLKYTMDKDYYDSFQVTLAEDKSKKLSPPRSRGEKVATRRLTFQRKLSLLNTRTIERKSSND